MFSNSEKVFFSSLLLNYVYGKLIWCSLVLYNIILNLKKMINHHHICGMNLSGAQKIV